MRYHFSGVAGAGMNPLACLMRARGHEVQGSDRSFDQGKNREIAAHLRRLAIQLSAHDGTAVTPAIDRFVYSAAVEADTPEMRAARALGLDCVSRPQLLAEVVNAGGPGVAVAGTGGKSTIIGMVAWLLRETGVPATVLGGAALVGEGTGGCFVAGPAEGPVVAEACESDGTLVGYRPAIGLVHNVSRDHAELDALRPQFSAFAESCGRLLVNAACPEAAALGRRFKASTYGVSPGADTRLRVTSAGPRRATGSLRLEGRVVVLDVPQPGLHNLENAAAATLLALELGVCASALEAPLACPGGAVAKDVSSRALAADLPAEMRCGYARDHDAVRQWALSEAQAGDTVLIMGARDPDLPRLARKVFESLSVWASSTSSNLLGWR